ncbi:MAG: hypothetical protein N3F64_02320 [Nitrososphaeria archaeon]|nr:hypothetical protein [Nitrososphaeria archaeon]
MLKNVFIKLSLIILASEIITIALLSLSKKVYSEPLVPASSDIYVATGNTLYLITISLAASFLFLWVIRKRFIKLEYIILFLKSILCCALFWVVSSLLLEGTIYFREDLINLLSIAILAVSLFIFWKRFFLPNLIISVLMSGSSAFLIKLMFSDLAVGLLLIGFALFDLYEVFRGPLKHLAQSMHSNEISLLLVKVDEIEVGIGDLLFYSLSTGLAYSVGGEILALTSIILIKLGVLATLLLLERRKMLPGLPLPVLLSVFATFLVSLLS